MPNEKDTWRNHGGTISKVRRTVGFRMYESRIGTYGIAARLIMRKIMALAIRAAIPRIRKIRTDSYFWTRVQQFKSVSASPKNGGLPGTRTFGGSDYRSGPRRINSYFWTRGLNLKVFQEIRKKGACLEPGLFRRQKMESPWYEDSSSWTRNPKVRGQKLFCVFDTLRSNSRPPWYTMNYARSKQGEWK